MRQCEPRGSPCLWPRVCAQRLLVVTVGSYLLHSPIIYSGRQRVANTRRRRLGSETHSPGLRSSSRLAEEESPVAKGGTVISTRGRGCCRGESVRTMDLRRGPKGSMGTSLVVQWMRIHLANAGDSGLTRFDPCFGKIPHTVGQLNPCT